jgi:branched-chain amino acid transport system substrate-binding protein
MVPIRTRLGSLLSAVLLACLLAACGEKEPVKVGFIGGVSGRFADLGTTGRNGVMLAVEWRNERGGLAGRRIALSIKDDEQDPVKARQALQELVSDQVVAVLGPMTSSIAAAIVADADLAGMLIVGGTATTSGLTGKDDNFIRTISTTTEYGSYAARTYRQQHGYKRAALIFDLANRDYTENWANEFSRTFEKEGGKVAKSLGFDSRVERDYAALADQLIRSKPDLVVIAANSVDGALLAQKLRQRDSKVRLAGSAWTGTQRLIELGGAAVEGMLIEQYYNQDDRSESYLRFREAYLKRFGFEPGFAGVVAFDAANLLFDALAENPDRKGLKERILKRTPFKGVQGDIRIDAFGDADRPITMTEVRGGKIIVAK